MTSSPSRSITHPCNEVQTQGCFSLLESLSSPEQQVSGGGQGWAWGPGAWLFLVIAHSLWLERAGQGSKMKANWVRHHISEHNSH